MRARSVRAHPLRTAALLLCAALSAGCVGDASRLDLPHHAAARPAGPGIGGALAETCPDFSGSYDSETLQGQTLLIEQAGCTRIATREVLPGIFDHAYTYHLDGTTRTTRQYAMHAVPFVAFFEGETLVFVGRGDGYTSVERWKLEAPDSIRVAAYAVRDSGRKYNELEMRYARATSGPAGLPGGQ